MIEKTTIEKMTAFLEDLNSSDVPTRINKLIKLLDTTSQDKERGFTTKELGKHSELRDSLCPSIKDILPILKRVNISAFNKGYIEFEDVERLTVEEYLKTI